MNIIVCQVSAFRNHKINLRRYKIFSTGTRICVLEIIQTFKQSIIHYINKSKFLAGPYLTFIVYLRRMFMMYSNFLLNIHLQ